MGQDYCGIWVRLLWPSETEVIPHAVLCTAHQIGILQQPEMARDAGLADPQNRLHLANTKLSLLKHLQDLHSGTVSSRLHDSQVFSHWNLHLLCEYI